MSRSKLSHQLNDYYVPIANRKLEQDMPTEPEVEGKAYPRRSRGTELRFGGDAVTQVQVEVGLCSYVVVHQGAIVC